MADNLYFLYCETANVADAENLLKKFNLTYDEHDAIQNGVKELSFHCADSVKENILQEILNGTIKVQFSNAKLPITGSIGSIATTITASDMKVGSTDQTSANAKYIKTKSTGEIYLFQPGAIVSGSQVTVSVAALAITSTTPIYDKLTLLASINNVDDLLIGDTTTQVFPLSPGQSIDISIDDAAKIFIKRSSSNNGTLLFFGS